MTEHKDIIHRRCGKRIADKIEHITEDGKSVERGDRICRCGHGYSSQFTSRPNPPDLQFYDKFLK